MTAEVDLDSDVHICLFVFLNLFVYICSWWNDCYKVDLDSDDHICLFVYLFICYMFTFAVDEMIAEVDLDGDGRIDFEGKHLLSGILFDIHSSLLRMMAPLHAAWSWCRHHASFDSP